MRLHTQISLICIFVLSVTVLVTLTVAIRDIKQNGDAEISAAKTEHLFRVKKKLKEIVGIGYSLIANNYESINNPKRLESVYGSTLKSSVNAGIMALNKYTNKTGLIKTTFLLSECGTPGRINVYACKIGSANSIVKDFSKTALLKTAGFIFNPSGKPFKLAYFKKISGKNILLAAGVTESAVVADAIRISKQQIRCISYEKGGQGYIFVNNLKAHSVVHPFKPEIEGADYSKIPDSTGKFHVPQMVDICKRYGEGFLTYYWPKHEFNNVNAPPAKKLSFVKLFKPWGWVIGTGEYIDNIDHIVKNKEIHFKQQVNLLALKVLVASIIISSVMILLSLLFASSISNPIVKLIKTMKEIKLNELSGVSISLRGSHEIRELGSIFNKMLRSIHDGIRTLKQTSYDKERLQSQLKIAKDIQFSILPKLAPILPKAKEFDIFAKIKPGTPPGGDLYDFFFVDDEHLCLSVGDVSDKGVPATLFMTVTRTLLRAKAAKGLSAGEIVTEMNKSICTGNDSSMYVRFFMAILNLNTGILTYTNAGHIPIILIRNDKRQNLESLPVVHGIPLGIEETGNYDDDQVTLKNGDKLIFYTDGLINAVNYVDERFGSKRFEAAISKSARLSAQNTVEDLFSQVNDFIGNTPVNDDIAIMTLCYKK